jgi:uncharacterized membrane protein YeaQ/YmgE (transglycosylase-associated protein family)
MDTVVVILTWALCGLVIGLMARLLVPGPQPLGLVRTSLLGVVGAFLGGLLYWAINRSPGEPFSFSANAWHGWIFSIIGAVIVLVVYGWWAWSRPLEPGLVMPATNRGQTVMPSFLFVLLLLIGGVVALGFYRGWFSFKTTNDPVAGRGVVQLEIDRNKIQPDLGKVREKFGGGDTQAEQKPVEQHP